MADITCLGYYVLGVSDLKAWEDFAVDILGLQIGYYDGDERIGLRMDEYEQRVILEKNPIDDFVAAGWQFDNELDLEQFVEKLARSGVEVSDGGKEMAQSRRVKKVYVCEDPNGIKHELYFGPAFAPVTKPFRSKVLTGPGFTTGRLGIGHFVPVSKNYEDSTDFYINKLGLRVTDYIQMEIDKGVVVETTFMHTVTGRHHSVAATMPMPHPKRIRHIMFEVQDMFDIGMAYERAKEAGCLAKYLGQHTNDRMLSFYIWTPSGYQIEYGWGGMVVNDDTWNTSIHQEASSWGHQPLTGGLL